MSNTKDKKYIVYLHTLLKENNNNMYYVGITSQKPELRWKKNGNGYKNNKHFYRAIQKYGWENFKHEILAENLSSEDAQILEKSYILLYNSADPLHGYNKTYGGLGGGNEVVFLQKGKIFQFSLDHTYINCYISIDVAEKETNISQISSAIAKHRPRNGFLWGGEEDVYFENGTYHLKYKYKNNNYNKVYQFDRNGCYINTYENHKQAAKETYDFSYEFHKHHV